jgi:hypothetical protein
VCKGERPTTGDGGPIAALALVIAHRANDRAAAARGQLFPRLAEQMRFVITSVMIYDRTTMLVTLVVCIVVTMIFVRNTPQPNPVFVMVAVLVVVAGILMVMVVTHMLGDLHLCGRGGR